MSTKFILHGGFAKDGVNEDNYLFYSEILKDTPLSPKILLVPFAKDEIRIIPATEKISREFQNIASGKELHITVATKEKFNEMKESGDFFESGCWHECYGTPKSEFSRIQESGKVPVLEIGHRGMMKMKEILKETDWELQPVGVLPGELSYSEVLEKHPEMQISFNIETGTPEIPNQSDRMVLIDEYKNLLRDRMKYRSRESDEEIEKKIENSSDILEFFLSGQAKENGFKMVSNEMWNKENPVKELLLRAKFLNEFRPGVNEIKMR